MLRSNNQQTTNTQNGGEVR